MIKYKLECKNCNIQFDSWFANSKDYEKLKKLNHLSCHLCNSLNIDKTLMSPNILNSKKQEVKDNENKKYINIKSKIKEYQKFIQNNFNYVGENFAYEARSIHYNNKKKQKNIYGKASIKEVKELKEEGIETEMIPWISENDN